eukprot:6728662-Karenia_brevis.AAC.1
MHGGYKRLRLNLEKFAATTSDCALPPYNEYPVVFDVQSRLQNAKLFDDNFTELDVGVNNKKLQIPVATQMESDPDPSVVLIEVVVNLEDLKAYVKTLKDVSQKAEKTLINSYLKRIRTHGEDDTRFPHGKVLQILYIERSGRLFAIGISQQQMANKTRAVCAGAWSDAVMPAPQVTLDLDFVNCVISVAAYLAEEHGLADSAQIIMKLAGDPFKYRKWLSAYYSIDEKEVKKVIYQVVFGGVPPDDNPFLWQLKEECFLLSQELLLIPEYQHFAELYTDRANPAASRMAAILFTCENQFLMKFKAVIEASQAEFNTSVLMFDGMVVNILGDVSNQIIQDTNWNRKPLAFELTL